MSFTSVYTVVPSKILNVYLRGMEEYKMSYIINKLPCKSENIVLF